MRIGILPAMVNYIPLTSNAKVWGEILGRLERRATVEVGGPDSDVDVWLIDGHQGGFEGLRGPVVVHMHESAQDPVAMAAVHKVFSDVLSVTEAAAVARAAAIVTGSYSSARQFENAHGCEVVVAPDGVDHAVFRPDGPRHDPGYRYALFVGFLHQRKNVGAVREGVERAGLRLEAVMTDTIAPDPEWPLTRALEPLGTGPVVNHAGCTDEELAALMRGAVALVMPSHSEGFGLPVVEALACGTPVVVSSGGALPEVTGPGGLIVDPPTGDRVGDALARIADDPDLRAELSRRGIEHAAQFTWSRTAEIVFDLLTETVRQHRRSPVQQERGA